MKMKRIQLVSLIVCFALSSKSQQITIQPYLQDASPQSIWILWETDSNDESIVEWGLTDALGNETMGTAVVSDGEARVHEVQLTGLERFTVYYYRVKTGAATSDIFQFKTPPFAGDHKSFRIVAMSDMQKDGSHPDKFREIVEEGVIDYLKDNLGGSLVHNLALVLIPGDLVVNGNTFGQWKNDFFNPAERLFTQIPLYPVLGNHENNAAYYFTYFKMPDNGTSGFEEHWWYKDYGNVRIIGLDSNTPFANADQLLWLSDVLDATSDVDSIDFVFAQLHHPHKSELWTPGESDFTGEVIQRLEQFTQRTQKPSIHFFGHTHGYSRGQSRDHKHLWINVATAGGAIDNWGEFPNFDYDEFSVSQDEYGFVVVEVTDGDDPTLTIKRISRGDQDIVIDNELTDSLTIGSTASVVTTPTAVYPVDQEVVPECVTLKASAFSSPDTDASHGQTHWQVTTFLNGFDNPIAESWKSFENWYFDVNTQAEDDLTDEVVPGLEAFATYAWRVRYRDKALNWSDWSEPASFTTTASMALPNLLENNGAENDLEAWDIVAGVVEALTAEVCNGIAPYKGEKYFIVGGLCEHSEIGIAIQNIDVSMQADSIDAGWLMANFGGFLSNYGGIDLPEMRLVYLDGNGEELGQSTTLSSLNNSWTMVSAWSSIPQNTRSIQVELKGTRRGGTDNDSYFDELFLRVGTGPVDCDAITSTTTPISSSISALKIVPNPLRTHSTVYVPDGLVNADVRLDAMDHSGRKVNLLQRRINNAFVVEKGDLPPGAYVLWLRLEGQVVGIAKLIVSNN